MRSLILILFTSLVITACFDAGYVTGEATFDAGSSLSMADGLAVQSIKSTQMSLAWEDRSQGENGYDLQRCDDLRNNCNEDDYSTVASLEADSDSYDDTNLTPSSDYTYRVRPRGEGQVEWAYLEDQRTAPAAATGVSISALATVGFDVNWTDNASDEDGYVVEIYSDAAHTTLVETVTAAADSTSVSIATLSTGTTYYPVVKATRSDVDGDETAASSATTLVGPTAATACSLVSETESAISFSWTDNDAVAETSYEIERCSDIAASCAEIDYSAFSTPAMDSTSETDNTVSAGTSYTYRIRPVNGSGPGDWLTCSSFTSAPAAPSAGTSGSITTVGFDLGWTDNAANESQFEIEVHTNAGYSSLVNTYNPSADATSYTINDLSSAVSYYARIRATDSGGRNSSWLNFTGPITTASAPTAASACIKSSGDEDEITIGWTDNDAVAETNYEVERCDNVQASCTSGDYSAVTGSPFAADTVSFADSGLSANSDYHYRIRSTIAAGPGTWLDCADFETAPSPPASVTMSTATVNGFDINWTDVTGETSYEIEVHDVGTYTNSVSSHTPVMNATTQTESSLSSATNYWVRMRSVGSGGNSSWYNAGSFATLNTAPTLATNGGLTIDVADTGTVIANTALNVTDPEQAAASRTYTVRSIPGHGDLQLSSTTLAVNDTFTQADIDASNLTYDHTAVTDTNDSFTFSVSDGIAEATGATTASPATFSITINNTAPTLDINIGMSITEGDTTTITTTELDSSDSEHADANIVYTITTAPSHGNLRNNTVVLAASDTFTQAELVAGDIDYVHTGADDTDDSFAFSVQDGASAFATTATTGSPASFNITVNAYNPIPSSLIMHYDATDATTFTGPSTAITAIADKSTAGNDGTPNNALAIATGALNGQDAFDLDGNDYIRVVNGGAANAFVDDTFTIAIYLQINATPTWAYIIGKDNYWGTGYGMEINSGNLGGYTASGPAGTRYGITSGSPHLYVMVADGTNVTVYEDGVQVYTESHYASLNSLSYNYNIGAASTNNYYLTAYVGEVMHFTDALNATDRGNLETYLLAKWNPPSTPTACVKSGGDNNEITISWTDDDTVADSGHEVQRCDDTAASGTCTGGAYATISGSPVTAGTATVTDTALSASSDYHYRIRAIGASVNSAWLDCADFQTAPAPPATLTPSSATGVGFDLAWTDSSSDETSFEIQVHDNSGYSSLVSTVSAAANATSYTITTAPASTTFYTRIRAVGPGGNSEWTNAGSSITTTGAQSMPTGVTASVSGFDTTIDWTDPSGSETGFTIQRCANLAAACADGDYSTVGGTQAANAITYTDSGLAQGDYSYRIRTEGAPSYSAWVYANDVTVGIPTFNPGYQIIASNMSTCMLKANNVYCTGADTYGQLANGAGDTNQAVFTAVTGTLGSGSVVTKIDGAYDTYCALKTDQTLWCWGRNDQGQLGQGTTSAEEHTPLQVTGLADVIDFSVGKDHVCAISEPTAGNTTAYCWGLGTNGQLGQAANSSSTSIVQMKDTDGTSNIADVKHIAAGGITTCVVKTDEAVYCTGRNGGNTDNIILLGATTSVNYITAVPGLPTFTDITKLDRGDSGTCLIDDGTVYCFGNYGANGIHPIVSRSALTNDFDIPALSSDVYDIQLSHGNQSTGGGGCAIKAYGTYCWGVNSGLYTRLSTNYAANYASPFKIPALAGNTIQASAGRNHLCAIDLVGRAYCWGEQVNGYLGNNQTASGIIKVLTQTTTYPTIDVQASAPSAPSSISEETLKSDTDIRVSWTHYSDETEDYEVEWCSGSSCDFSTLVSSTTVNGTQQSLFIEGLTANTVYRVRVRATNIAGNSSWTASSDITTLASDPSVNSRKLSMIPGNSAPNNACVLKDGELRCVGINSSGELGQGDTAVKNKEYYQVSVIGASGVVDVSSGTGGACAIYKDESLWCWGDTSSSFIPFGNSADVLEPTLVIDSETGDFLTKTKQIAMGINLSFPSCAIVENASANNGLRCWGDLWSDGRDGIEMTILAYNSVDKISGAVKPSEEDVASPPNTIDPADIALFSSFGFYGACYVKTDGTIYCTGSDFNDGRGTATTVYTDVGIAAGTYTGITKFQVEYKFMCFIDSGALYCWGTSPTFMRYNPPFWSNQTSPTLVPGMESGVTDFVLSRNALCALKDGSLYCKGLNTYGILGSDYTASAAQYYGFNKVGEFGRNVDQIAMNDLNLCVMTETGLIQCIGNNDNGVFAVGNTTANTSNFQTASPWPVIDTATSAPSDVSSLTVLNESIDQMELTWSHSDSSVASYEIERCDGAACDFSVVADSQTGIAAGKNTYVMTGLSLNATYRFRIRGVNAFGNGNWVGSGDVSTLSSNPAAGTRQIVTARNSSCALYEGEVRCWGYNNLGQIGDGSTGGTYSVPTSLAAPLDSAIVKKIAGVDGTNEAYCALTIFGRVYCWGSYFYNGLGMNNSVGTPTLIRAPNGEALDDVVDIRGGYDRMCALVEISSGNNTAYCWGDNSGGQLAQGHTDTAYSPQRILDTDGSTAIQNVKVIDPGYELLCLAKTDEHIYCAGDAGSAATYGHMSATSNTTLTEAAGSNVYTDITDIRSDNLRICVVDNGGLECVGGDGNLLTSSLLNTIPMGRPHDAGSTPTSIHGFTSNISELTYNYTKNLCLLKGETPYCYGDQTYGENGSSEEGMIRDTIYPLSIYGYDHNIASVHAGYSHTCMMDNLGQIYCVGANNRGQLGRGTTSVSESPYAMIASWPTIAVATGNPSAPSSAEILYGTSHDTVDVKWDHSGDATVESYTIREYGSGCAGLLNTYTAIANTSNNYRVTGLTPGSTYCFSVQAVNAFGTSSEVNTGDITTLASDPAAVASVSAGESFTCSAFNGAVKCTGQNNYHQLGIALNDTTTRSTLTATNAWLSNFDVKKLVSGQRVTCALLVDSRVMCWGQNNYGTTGAATYGNADDVPAFVRASGGDPLRNVVDIEMKEHSACAKVEVTSGNYNLYCWGKNVQSTANHSILGVNKEFSGSFVAIPMLDTDGSSTLSDIVDFAVARDSVCVLKSDNNLYCTGVRQTYSGMSAGNKMYLSLAQSFTAPTKVWTGETHYCVEDTNLYCWGDNGYGQIGDGAGSSTATPTLVSSASILDMNMGLYHSCYVTTANDTYCVGANTNGQLGDGTTTNSSTAATGFELIGVGGQATTAVSVGDYHTCASSYGDSEVRCWGQQQYGRLGNGATATSSISSAVLVGP